MYGKSNRSYGHSLREGISAVRRGNKNLAWTLLHQAAELNPLDPTPWLWLTEATDDVKEKIDYLEQALAAGESSPNRALKGLGFVTLTEEECLAADKHGLSFININTTHDLEMLHKYQNSNSNSDPVRL